MLYQAVAKPSSTGVSGSRLAPTVRMSEQALAQIDEAILAVTDALP